jgi:hypothetical protein
VLTTITRKLCPLITLAIATIGCGKKISESGTDVARSIEQHQESSVVIVKLIGNESSRKSYSIPRNGIFSMPSSLRVRQGSGIGKTVVIHYNIDESDPEDYMFKCTYHSLNEETELPLNNCKDRYGMDLGHIIDDHQFPFYYGKLINIKLTTGSSRDLVIDAIYSIDWK